MVFKAVGLKPHGRSIALCRAARLVGHAPPRRAAGADRGVNLGGPEQRRELLEDAS